MHGTYAELVIKAPVTTYEGTDRLCLFTMHAATINTFLAPANVLSEATNHLGACGIRMANVAQRTLTSFPFLVHMQYEIAYAVNADQGINSVRRGVRICALRYDSENQQLSSRITYPSLVCDSKPLATYHVVPHIDIFR